MTDRERGKLKIYMGYAAGVGKTFKMLEEAQALKADGADIVIGYFEPHGRKDTIAKTEGLETVPTRLMEYRGSAFQEMDTNAILARRPQICVVDEFPHTNVPWFGAGQAVGRRSGAARCRHSCAHHDEHPAPGKPE
jgi:two-component system sensor histidine kinase KdpD